MIAQQTESSATNRSRVPTWLLVAALLGLGILHIAITAARVPFVGPLNASLPESARTLAAFGFVLLGAWLLGRCAARAGLPALSGQLLFGIATGPEVWELIGHANYSVLSTRDLQALAPVEALALVMIGLVAGAEVDGAFLRAQRRAIACMALGGISCVGVAVGTVAWMWTKSAAQAGLLALVAATSSSAVSVALLREMREPSPFARLLLATTLCKDLALVLAFSLVIAWIATQTPEHPLAFSWNAVAWRLAGSVVIGALAAWPLARSLPYMGTALSALVVVVSLGIVAASTAFGLVGLVVGVAFGFALRAFAPERSEPFFDVARRLFLSVCCVLFAMSGAHIDLAGLLAYWPLVLLLSATRLVAVWAALRVSAGLAGLPPTAARSAWTGFVPQAGLSLALVAQALVELSEVRWMRPLAAAMIACIALSEIVGPVLMRIGLRRVGDAPLRVP